RAVRRSEELFGIQLEQQLLSKHEIGQRHVCSSDAAIAFAGIEIEDVEGAPREDREAPAPGHLHGETVVALQLLTLRWSEQPYQQRAGARLGPYIFRHRVIKREGFGEPVAARGSAFCDRRDRAILRGTLQRASARCKRFHQATEGAQARRPGHLPFRYQRACSERPDEPNICRFFIGLVCRGAARRCNLPATSAVFDVRAVAKCPPDAPQSAGTLQPAAGAGCGGDSWQPSTDWSKSMMEPVISPDSSLAR